MASRLPSHLSHKSALALLPPSGITAPIEAVRRVHDKHFTRWPPHVNLLYPFLASPADSLSSEDVGSLTLQDSIRERIQKAVKSIEPFRVSLQADPPGIFSHSKRSKTVWLGPSTHNVQHLQAALQSEFAECDADQRPFTPHLSIGQAHSDTMALKLGDEIKNCIRDSQSSNEDAPVALDWLVDRVYVIARKGYHDRFKVVGSIELGKE